MKEDFKKWLCKKAGEKGEIHNKEWFNVIKLEILIKAMWAINWDIGIGCQWSIFMDGVRYRVLKNGNYIQDFSYERFNNSEQEALTKALEYIYKQGE